MSFPYGYEQKVTGRGIVAGLLLAAACAAWCVPWFVGVYALWTWL